MYKFCKFGLSDLTKELKEKLEPQQVNNPLTSSIFKKNKYIESM
jgi:hypothetical protein